MITEKKSVQKENASTGFQPRTQTTSVILNRNKNNIEITETSCLTDVTGISIPTNSTLITGITIPLQAPTKTIQSNSDCHKDPNTTENFISHDNFFGATSHEFQVKKTAAIL